MLKIINLHVIDKIFKSTKEELGQGAKFMYVNCLINYFRDKEASFENAYAFEVMEEDVDYGAFKAHFSELHKAGLITIMLPAIRFENKWGQLIDRTKLNTVTAKSTFKISESKKFHELLLNRKTLHELCAIKYGLSESQVLEMIKEFNRVQSEFEHPYMSEVDCAKHAYYWIGKNIKKALAGKHVKSNAKILGR